VHCPQTENGCPWTGPRRSLLTSHSLTCPYESIKGFYPTNNARISRLADENIILKHKVELMEGFIQTMRREMQSVRTALGPWYRPDGVYSSFPASTAVDMIQPEPHSTSGARPFSLGSDVALSPPLGFDSFSPGDINHLASYFPPPTEEQNSQVRRSSIPMHHTSLSVGQPQDHSHPQSLNAHSRVPASHGQQTPVAPINLSTTLEGSLASLRESIVALSASVDSLARRNDIALRNETLRLNDDILTLRASIHGLRMQVCVY
jgi:hypothetical protein